MNVSLIKLCAPVLVALALQGCAKHDKGPENIEITDAVASNGSSSSAAQPSTNERLQKCMFEAGQLSDMTHGKYAGKKDQLYNAIREAKYYATVAAKISPDTADSMTPYYQYKINDICNDIAWTMYNELKAGTLVLPDTK